MVSTKIRFVTAASLFDGHDVSINIMRRLLQSKGVEVIHLGHNRSAAEVVDAAISEDVQAIALSSYQGGHNEYFAYIRELLDAAGRKDVRIFGGGGGVITHEEVNKLESIGITKIYTPFDGMKLGLEGIVNDMIEKSSFSTIGNWTPSEHDYKSRVGIARTITWIENQTTPNLDAGKKKIPVIGFTGTGGAGKSSLIDEILIRMREHFGDKKVALLSIDPTRRKTQGALLGDRIRLTCNDHPHFYIRSLATRESQVELSPQTQSIISFLKRTEQFDIIFVETSGIGQSSDAIVKVADASVYVMTSEYGAQTQLEKIEMLDVADIIVINKFEKPRSEDALRDVRKQYRRNRQLFDNEKNPDESLPVFGTKASQFNDSGVNGLFVELTNWMGLKVEPNSKLSKLAVSKSENYTSMIPISRQTYLRGIAESVENYNLETERLAQKVSNWEGLTIANQYLKEVGKLPNEINLIAAEAEKLNKELSEVAIKKIEDLEAKLKSYSEGKWGEVATKFESLSGTQILKVSAPKLKSKRELFVYLRKSHLPGSFPFAAGIFPFKRSDEEPKRQFAGEGGPLRTNERFHFLSKGDDSKRLSTAFDSVTLYGEDPDLRPDIYGKIGESGVSIATLDDMSDLYRGFDLFHPKTSVSMTINGPASIILAMFFNAALKQKLSEEERADWSKCLPLLQSIRGTVQADILKEDQAQNTCIFSLDFSLKLMGDVQEFFCKQKLKNYYSVSISGYHIAEAGANPITQLAFTLANGFTYLEYYLNRGLPLDQFCENFSFFFSNGLDPEYSVLGRVARKIWAVALRDKYGASEKSQKLKYHIQTSGRSLHAQEIDFNDIRTTLQAFLALSDNCNSLHTNAYDEAITTPTTESVRRAMAIQMIINREFGINKSDNPLQGSYMMEELADLVETAVLEEFKRISDRGGVLGAMESMYQRGKIQDESHHYESLKDSGKFPIIGVNTFLNPNQESAAVVPITRASDGEKQQQIDRLRAFHKRNEGKSAQALLRLKEVALAKGNIFEELMTTVNYCSLGQITKTLYEVGGRYRRNV
ncbi:MAG: methylmalonyl-CoA mutase family protein [Bacteriovoracaceae bacterium]|nr:methylmalonyl-CoA mutase family protein [Bacteriovoracaceae bacterium]